MRLAMNPPDRDTFRYQLRQLDLQSVRRFIADLWGAAGWETTIKDSHVIASRKEPTPEHHKIGITTAPGILTKPTLSMGAGDLDILIIPGRNRANRFADIEGTVFTADEVYDRLFYGLDRATAVDLLIRHFDTHDATLEEPSAPIRLLLADSVWHVRQSPLESAAFVILVVIIGIGLVSTGSWLASGSLGSNATVPASGSTTPVQSGPVGATATVEATVTTRTPSQINIVSASDIPQPNPVSPGDWRMFQFDLNRTGWNRWASGPRTDPVVVANTSLSSGIFSSPAVVGGRLYIGTMDGELYIINASNLRQLISVEIGDQVSSSPAVTDKMTFVGAAEEPFSDSSPRDPDRGLAAINHTAGTKRFNKLSIGVTFSSPAIRNDTIYIGSVEGDAHAINRTSGVTRWSASLNGTIFASPALFNKSIYFATTNNSVYALNASSGSEHWLARTTGQIASTPTIGDGALYIGDLSGTVYALSTDTGRETWSRSVNGSIFSSPAVAHNSVFVGTINETVHALNQSSGANQWKVPVNGSIESSPVVANETVYFATTNGVIYAFNVSNGNLRWKLQIDGEFTSSPAIANESMYIATVQGTVLRIKTA